MVAPLTPVGMKRGGSVNPPVWLSAAPLVCGGRLVVFDQWGRLPLGSAPCVQAGVWHDGTGGKMVRQIWLNS